MTTGTAENWRAKLVLELVYTQRLRALSKNSLLSKLEANAETVNAQSIAGTVLD